MIDKRKNATLIRRLTYTAMAVIMSAVMLLSSGSGSFAYAPARDVSYKFDHTRTAVDQLSDLFTTIDIMDATVAGLSEEMEKGSVTSEQLVQMYIDRIQAYDKKKKLNSIILPTAGWTGYPSDARVHTCS